MLIDLRLQQLKYTGINTWSIIYLLCIFVSIYLYLYLFIYLLTYLLKVCGVIILPTCRPRTGHLNDDFPILIMHRKTNLLTTFCSSLSLNVYLLTRRSLLNCNETLIFEIVASCKINVYWLVLLIINSYFPRSMWTLKY